MDVENAIGKGGDEAGREQAHVAGQADEVDTVVAQAGNHVGIVLGALAAFGDKDCVRQTQLTCRGDAGSVGDI